MVNKIVFATVLQADMKSFLFNAILFCLKRVYADQLPHMKLFVLLIQLLILLTNIPMLLSTLKNSLTMLDSLLVVSCINR
jgi:hypothetical protein